MLKIGDMVDVADRQLTHYGRLDEILPNQEARVHLKKAREPKERNVCDACKFPGMLSVNGGTGEIVCMRSGCGHEYGFEERDEIIPIGQLINVSGQRLNKKKVEFKQEVASLLQRGIADKVMTAEQSATILKLF